MADNMLFIGGASYRAERDAGGLYGLRLVDYFGGLDGKLYGIKAAP